MYTATFMLTQDDEGMVTPSLVFNPLIDPSKGDAPPIYAFMADCALSFFRAAELIDDNGNWVSDEAPDATVLELSRSATTH